MHPELRIPHGKSIHFFLSGRSNHTDASNIQEPIRVCLSNLYTEQPFEAIRSFSIENCFLDTLTIRVQLNAIISVSNTSNVSSLPYERSAQGPVQLSDVAQNIVP